ncbi:MAG: APC family permease [Chitinophagaceae bacterium]
MRKISFISGVAIVAGSIIGSGVFIKPASMAAQLGSPMVLLLVWVLAGLFTFLGAVIFAELGAMLPITGGIYAYFRYIFGPFFAYLYGWAAFSVINTAAVAAIAYVCAAYANHFLRLPEVDPELVARYALHIPGLGDLYPLDTLGVKLVAIGIVLSLTWLNARTLRGGSLLQLISTILKIAVLALLIAAIFGSGAGSTNNWVESDMPVPQEGWLSAMLLAITGAFYAYDGWINITFMAGELKEPKRNIPKVLFTGVFICIVVYVVINLAYLYALPVQTMAGSTLVASDAIAVAWGQTGANWIAAMIVICTFGAVNGNIMACSRVTYAMGRDGVFPSWTGKLHPRYETPASALWLHGVWTCLFLITGSFDMLADMFVFVTWLAYGMGAIGLLILRRREPARHRPYKVWGYPWVPWIFVLFTVYYFIGTVTSDIQNYINGRQPVVNSLMGLMIVALGIPLYFLSRRRITDAR